MMTNAAVPKTRVLELGPAPPLTGGMATVIDAICRSRLADTFEIVALNSGKTTRPNRTLIEGIIAQLRLLCRLVATLHKRQIQIVHLHTCEFLGFWRDCVHALLARIIGCQLIWHVHGARFDQWAARQGPIRKRLLRRAFERADAVIVLSPQWENRLAPFAPKANWRVIPNGIPMPPSAPTLPNGDTRFFFLGDWTPRKGVRDLVAASALAHHDHGFRGTLVLAGFEKEPGQRAELDEFIRHNGAGAWVEILGRISGVDKDRAFATTHCLVLPSYGEGLPMAILEAMSYGRAIVATRVGAIPELITEDKDGFLMEPGDVPALARILARLDSDRELLERAGAAARQRVEEEYSLEVMLSKLETLFLEVVAS